MNRSDSESEDDDLHLGHDLEAGLIARVREWTDLFPWLRLTRTMRVAASPPLILLVALVLAVWSSGMNWLLLDANDNRDPLVVRATMPLPYGEERFPVKTDGATQVTEVAAWRQVLSQTRWLIPATLPDLVRREPTRVGLWPAVCAVAWSLLMWTPMVLLLLRQGALLTAARPLNSFRQQVTLSLRRTPNAWLIAIVPLLCVAVIALLIGTVGWLARFTFEIAWLEKAFAAVVALIALPCGVLAMGAHVAVPLGWAATANEKDADALDALSRGYEYLLRRPLQLVGYSVLGAVVLGLLAVFATWVAIAAIQIAGIAMSLVGCPDQVHQEVVSILGHLPLVLTVTLFWAWVGGTYLLLRCDAGGQEVEDLWVPEPVYDGGLPRRGTTA